MVRRKNSALKDIIDITTMLPWWVGAILAVVSFFIFHYVAGIKLEKVEVMPDFSDIPLAKE